VYLLKVLLLPSITTILVQTLCTAIPKVLILHITADFLAVTRMNEKWWLQKTIKKVKLRTHASYLSDIYELENGATISKGLKSLSFEWMSSGLFSSDRVS